MMRPKYSLTAKRFLKLRDGGWSVKTLRLRKSRKLKLLPVLSCAKDFLFISRHEGIPGCNIAGITLVFTKVNCFVDVLFELKEI